MSNTGITEKMWEMYGLMYATEQIKKPAFVADWMHITVGEVEQLLTKMKKIEPALFTDIVGDRRRFDNKVRRLSGGDDSKTQKTSSMRSD